MPTPSHFNHTAWNLLFGSFAAQMGFLNPDDLPAALAAWLADKKVALGGLLVQQGRLSPERHRVLEELVREHLRAHGNNPRQSLAALVLPPDLRHRLYDLGDSELQACLELVPQTQAVN